MGRVKDGQLSTDGTDRVNVNDNEATYVYQPKEIVLPSTTSQLRAFAAGGGGGGNTVPCWRTMADCTCSGTIASVNLGLADSSARRSTN